MKKHTVGLKFIKMSIHFINYKNLYNILNMVEDQPMDKDRKEIEKIVLHEIYKRDHKLVKKKMLKDGKEIWIKTKR